MGEKRGRPAKFDRTEAVRRAMELFWREGFAAASARDLAEAMQINPSSFYNSFGNRESVFREALTLYGAEAPDAALRNVPANVPVLPILWEMFRAVCRVRAADPQGRGCLVVNSVAELVGTEPMLGDEIANGMKERVALVDALLAQAEAQGEIAGQTDRRAAADAIVAFLCGINLLAKVIRDEEALWRMCEQVLTSLGLAPHGSFGPAEPSPAQTGSRSPLA